MGLGGVEEMVRDMRDKYPEYLDELNDVMDDKTHWKDATSNVMDHVLDREEMLKKYGWNESNWTNWTNQSMPMDPMRFRRRRLLPSLFDIVKKASLKSILSGA